MSTRCQIDFVVKGRFKNGKAFEERRRVYRHSDGYPNGEAGVIAELEKFLNWNNGRNTDVEYAAANFIYWSKKEMVEHFAKWKKERGDKYTQEDHDSDAQLGFGVCDPKQFHSDIEYWYEVINEYGKKPIIMAYEVNHEHGWDCVSMKNMKKIQIVPVEIKEVD